VTTWTWRFKARPNRVIDGDTAVMAADLGFRVTMDVTVRLNGCNAAPGKTPEGAAATEFVSQWFLHHIDVDGYVRILTHAYPGDPHGRWLAEVQSTDGLHDLTDDLIAAGLAVPYGGSGPKPDPVPPVPVTDAPPAA
jgi:endonuclease YncB( thermonuclease family)